MIVLIDGVVCIGGGVTHTCRYIVDKVFGGFLDGDVLGIAVHTSDIAVYNLSLIVRQWAEGYACHLCKLLSSIIGSQWCPMVVCTQEDVFISMFAQGCIDIYGFDVR